jgi:hypothetical protein
MALETVPNDLDQDVHTCLDQQVLESDTIRTSFQPVNISQPASLLGLLVAIIEESNEQLDPQYYSPKIARALLTRHPELVEKLKEAWMKKSFEEIRNLSEFLPLSQMIGVMFNDCNITEILQNPRLPRLSSHNSPMIDVGNQRKPCFVKI